MFLGGLGKSCEDNIFFLVHELFTGLFPFKERRFFDFFTKKGASFREAPAQEQALYTS